MPHQQLKAHGLSKKQLNILFACLFGFPVVMGALLAAQSYDFSQLFKRNSETIALSAPQAQRVTFQDMIDPPWETPLEIKDFGKYDLFKERFDELDQRKLALLLGLPDPQETASRGDFGESTDFIEIDQLSLVPPPLGSEISGKPEVIDAVTLALASARVKLAGLKPPEEDKTCTLLAGETRNCRKAGAEQLSFFLSFRVVQCQVTGQAGDGSGLAKCRIGGTDIGEWLVRRGWAVPEDAADPLYRAAALFAQSYKLGQWRL